jgi:hypothetical protein
MSEYVEGLLHKLALHGALVDVVLPDSEHRYFSTHCRHGGPQREDGTWGPGHDDCAATEIRRGDGVVPKSPAQCKTCSAACACPCGHPELASRSLSGGNA